MELLSCITYLGLISPTNACMLSEAVLSNEIIMMVTSRVFGELSPICLDTSLVRVVEYFEWIAFYWRVIILDVQCSLGYLQDLKSKFFA